MAAHNIPTDLKKSLAPYRYQDYLIIQNMKVLSWDLNFQNPKPKTGPGSSTVLQYTCTIFMNNFYEQT